MKKDSGLLQLLPFLLSHGGPVDLVTFDLSLNEMEESILVDLDEIVDLAQLTLFLVLLGHGAHSEVTVDGLENNPSGENINYNPCLVEKLLRVRV